MKKILFITLLSITFTLLSCKKEEIIEYNPDQIFDYSCFIQNIVNDTVISNTYFDRSMTYKEMLQYTNEWTRTIQHDGYIEEQYCSCNKKIGIK